MQFSWCWRIHQQLLAYSQVYVLDDIMTEMVTDVTGRTIIHIWQRSLQQLRHVRVQQIHTFIVWDFVYRQLISIWYTHTSIYLFSSFLKNLNLDNWTTTKHFKSTSCDIMHVPFVESTVCNFSTIVFFLEPTTPLTCLANASDRDKQLSYLDIIDLRDNSGWGEGFPSPPPQ